MFTINEDLSIYVTRGDIVHIAVAAENNGEAYTFKAGDVVRIKVFGKKDCATIVFQKDFPITTDSETVEIFLTSEETRIGGVINKHTDYWYEIELNPETNPQTIIGYDENGAKVFRIFPEGRDVGFEPVIPEDIPIIDVALDLTSARPVENRIVAREFERTETKIAAVENKVDGNTEEIEKTALDVTKLKNTVNTNKEELTQKIETEKATRIEETTALSGAVEENSADITQLKSQANELSRDVTNHNQKMPQLQAKINELSNAVDANSTAISNNDTKISKNLIYINELKQANENTGKKINIHSQQIQELEESVNTINREFSDKTYPVGSVYCTCFADTNPSRYFGGTWEFCNKEFAPKRKWITDEEGIGDIFMSDTYIKVTSVGYHIIGHSVTLSIAGKWNRGVTKGSTNIEVFRIANIHKLGIKPTNNMSSIHPHYCLANTLCGKIPTEFSVLTYQNADGTNGGIKGEIPYLNENTTTNQDFYATFTLELVPNTMIDEFCDRFYWVKISN